MSEYCCDSECVGSALADFQLKLEHCCIIIEQVEADEALSLAAPHIEKSAPVGNSSLLNDHKLGRMVEVQVRGKEKDLFCVLDKRNDCVHAGFAYAIPQVYAIMKKIKR